MKKYIVMLVMFISFFTAQAQTIDHFTQGGDVAVLTNGMRVNIKGLPGWQHFGRRLTIQENISQYFSELANEDPERYALELRAYQERGGVVVGGYGMMGTVGGYGYGYGMVGGAGYGMVAGAGGMAGATSSVHIDNSNMLSTVGSGLQMSYNSGSNSLSISGDPLMAIGRVVSAIGGSKKRRQQQAQQTQYSNYAGNGNTRVVYVDSRTGQQVQPQQQVRVVYVDSRTGQPVQTVPTQVQVQPQVQQTVPTQVQVQPQVQQQYSTSAANGFVSGF